MPLEIKDVAGLSKPLVKLIDVVSAAFGTVYRPKSIQTQAVAKAAEIEIIATAEANAGETRKRIALEGAIARAEIISRESPELAARATQRLLTREIEGQENIEAVVGQAIAALPSQVSEEAVSGDWRRRFFQEAENVCSADMQFLWGKVLAGEITKPGSFSIRTLDALRHLSQSEAELFRKACSIAMQDGWIATPGHDLNSALLPFGISYGDVITLRDSGLVVGGDSIHKDFSSVNNQPNAEGIRVILVNNGNLIELTGQGMAQLRQPALIFAKVGKELQQLIDPAPTQKYYKALGLHLQMLGVTAKLGKVISNEAGMQVIDFEQSMASIEEGPNPTL